MSTGLSQSRAPFSASVSILNVLLTKDDRLPRSLRARPGGGGYRATQDEICTWESSFSASILSHALSERHLSGGINGVYPEKGI
ncbi:hypothetical protein Naga_100163g3 [Nannochloropsis gaditana]|uniref:Uncharacterized protein n=1 Tax=Nannochloropsis gaditana TaxID=72520 RepID=W7TLH9_9STRA|nr:hypothetical protein Naga_100163g3 [Nannochloropsis gaditana]